MYENIEELSLEIEDLGEDLNNIKKPKPPMEVKASLETYSGIIGEEVRILNQN